MHEGDNLRFSPETLFAGGRLCLDFVNTSCLRRGEPLEFLGDRHALRRWLQLAEAIRERRLLGDGVDGNPEEDGALLARVHALRAALRALIDSAIEKRPAPAEALEAVNAVLREFPAVRQIAQSPAGFQETAPSGDRRDAWLAVIAEDAVDLLCHGDLSLLRQCECPTCIRVFYDTTKNHRRRWCVEKCGSAPKAAAYYRRKVARAKTGGE